VAPFERQAISVIGLLAGFQGVVFDGHAEDVDFTGALAC
jgi:hypothetical protein